MEKIRPDRRRKHEKRMPESRKDETREKMRAQRAPGGQRR